ncbi:hypothetical protein HDU91_006668, partial [Kappamyces sp. JEL0680]
MLPPLLAWSLLDLSAAFRVNIVPRNESLALSAEKRSVAETEHHIYPRILDSTIVTSFAYTLQIYVTVLGTTFLTQVDSGSWAAAFPYGSISGYSSSGYSGTAISTASYTIPSNAASCSQSYGGGSWSGKKVSTTVGISGTTISDTSTIGLIRAQSNFLTANQYEAILGVGLNGAVNQPNGIASPMDGWYAHGVISRNQIAFHSCPFSLSGSAWIDFGNDTANPVSCSSTVAKIVSPPNNNGYFTVDVRDIKIAGTSYSLGSTWQTSQYSFVDSGSGWLYLPSAHVTALQNYITANGGLVGTSAELSSYFGYQAYIPLSAIVWSKLPNITITMKSYGTNSYADMVLGPRQYLSQVSSTLYFFDVGAHDGLAILGYPVFT